jgi:SAM-dependent methyltransferase
MFGYAREVVARIERTAGSRPPPLPEILEELRQGLGLDDFGELLFGMPDPGLPGLSRILPRMASTQVQTSWTGTSGLALLKQTVSFVRALTCQFVRFTGRSVNGISVLDFGCGYGRIARLMYYFTDPDSLVGVDPWDESIRICHSCGLGENFRLSDRLPTELPVDGRSFDLLYAFSVFTHLSRRVALQALTALRKCIRDDGLLVITIRPAEYWSLDSRIHELKDTSKVRAEHAETGFAFSPLGFLVDGEATFGNTSMTTEWIDRNVPGWRVLGVDRSFDDEYQLYVFLRPS